MNLEFDKQNGLIPAVVQDADTRVVLMLGYMNEEALERTRSTRRVTFFSRTRNELWVKGETSGNYLDLVELRADCDNDTLLVLARPTGPVCHTGDDTCWSAPNVKDELELLEGTIRARVAEPKEGSYTNELLSNMNLAAQKVGEEAVELVIEAKDDNEERFLNEAADLLYHYTVLLAAKGYGLRDVKKVLSERRK